MPAVLSHYHTHHMKRDEFLDLAIRLGYAFDRSDAIKYAGDRDDFTTGDFYALSKRCRTSQNSIAGFRTYSYKPPVLNSTWW